MKYRRDKFYAHLRCVRREQKLTNPIANFMEFRVLRKLRAYLCDPDLYSLLTVLESTDELTVERALFQIEEMSAA